ncbi:hypothetical protein [Streptosporangium roseum]|uniref:Lipoprotein n=1 Tax=Streptosporangium roseum (strain ATCC 12428 / DSM 43021 / JCM 3005 / KCTC 9067 / NCIMB 10171 / NRRL 2505 / NI 9100) TaxID=479432 RepID=D2B4Q7_STRRD|nr:hypothetical protein [Streptosporangium roseum]ACZ85593.1 hypothetical protein Sros_2623 [Streptosporangium roseum DSM 43021]
MSGKRMLCQEKTVFRTISGVTGIVLVVLSSAVACGAGDGRACAASAGTAAVTPYQATATKGPQAPRAVKKSPKPGKKFKIDDCD